MSLAACEVVRRFALRRALLDAPNARSLHVTPTPRLGGVGIVLATVLPGLVTVPAETETRLSLYVACALAAVGLRDDVRPLSSGIRFAFQIALATIFLWRIGVSPLPIAPGVTLALPVVVVSVVLVVWMVGVLNIYNFMDGMDGLAGMQTAGAALALTAIHGSHGPIGSLALLLASASLGFLVHNFPPARMFLGDAGSYFIGILLAAWTVIGVRSGVPVALSALSFAPFLLDGTFTILRRARRGEKIWQAHRSHLYQRAVQAGLSHREVLVVYAVWIGASAGAAVIAGGSLAALVIGWLVALAGLLLVWSWVRRLESDHADLA